MTRVQQQYHFETLAGFRSSAQFNQKRGESARKIGITGMEISMTAQKIRDLREAPQSFSNGDEMRHKRDVVV